MQSFVTDPVVTSDVTEFELELFPETVEERCTSVVLLYENRDGMNCKQSYGLGQVPSKITFNNLLHK